MLSALVVVILWSRLHDSLEGIRKEDGTGISPESTGSFGKEDSRTSPPNSDFEDISLEATTLPQELPELETTRNSYLGVRFYLPKDVKERFI